MKKTLLLSTALVIGVAGFAQNARKAVNPKLLKRANSVHVAKKDATYNLSLPSTLRSKGPVVSPSLPATACGTIRFSSSMNPNGFGGAFTTYVQNALSYNKDLNTVVLTHRNSADWGIDGTPEAQTGSVQSNWINVGTNVQDSMTIYHSPANVLGARYPGGTVFNPTPGNTDITQSRMVGSGCVVSGANFTGIWYASRKPTGTYHANPTSNEASYCVYGSAPFGNVQDITGEDGMLNSDMQQVGNKVVVIGGLADTHVTAASVVSVKGAVIGKGVYNASGDSLVWSRDTIVPGFYHAADLTAGGYQSTRNPRIAFGADGQTGYVVFTGRLAQNYNTSADSMLAPIVYKTTDAGATWNPILFGYDWACKHPELMKSTNALAIDSGILTNPRHWNVAEEDGADLTVDANGVLHYVTTLDQGYLDGQYADTLGAYVYSYDYVNHHPYIWDLMTDGSDWKTMLVDSVITAYIPDATSTNTNNQYFTWSSANGPFAYGAHLTVSRSTDGTKVFYGWGDSDPSITSLNVNTQPDLQLVGYDVNTKMFSAKQNVTNNGFAYFSFLSDVSYFDGANYVVPATYSLGRDVYSNDPTVGPIYDNSKPVDYYYTNCGQVSSFGTAATVNPEVICLTGIKTNNAFESAISNYPNPFNHTTTIAVTLSENKAVDVKVYNAIGTLVFSKKVNGNVGENTVSFDGSALSSGVYYYTVTAGNQQATKKMVIQK